MSKHYIIGSGGLAKEVYFLAEEVLGKDSYFEGFIDKGVKYGKSAIEVRGMSVPLVDEDYFLENIKPSRGVCLFIGIGDPKLINKLTSTFSDYDFPNLIHESFEGDKKSINLGEGNLIAAGCIFTVDIKVGSYNIFNLNSTVGHDTEIGNCNIFNPGCNISGSVTIKNSNLIGTNATVLQKVKIGSNNIIGASSLTNKEIGDKKVMVGIPAKFIKSNE